jgi:hypothetical protein
MAGLSPSDTGLVVVLVLIVFIMARRTYMLVHGTVYSPERLAIFSAFYLALYLLAIYSTFTSLPLYSTALDGVLLVAAALIAIPYVERIVVLELRADGQWYYRLPVLIPVLYLVLFVLRLGLDIAVLGQDPFDFTLGAPLSLTPTQSILLTVVDALFSISTGILVGRSIAVYRAHQKRVAATGAASQVSAQPQTPLP